MRIGIASVACLLLLPMLGQAQDTKDAEQRLQRVRSELREVATQRRELEGQRGDATRQLRATEAQVGGTQRTLQQTRLQLQQRGDALQRLQIEQARHSETLQTRKAELARLLRAAQMTGESPALKALLAQDRVTDAERAMTLAGYLQRAQVQRIRELSAEIVQLQRRETAMVQERATLDAAGKQQALQLAQLQQTRQQRVGALAGIESQYQERSTKVQALERDAKALQNLLAQLRAEAARAARETAKAKAEAERLAKAQHKPVPRRVRPAPTTASLAQVGGMSWPVAGKLLANFGGRLPDGRRSDGVLIAAASGTPVKAVADGTVVFADWMTGYGNILIVDHGQGYMSLYAHNSGLLREAGERIQRGQSVATVGNSGGQDSPALYFELRRNGAPVNPGDWLKRQ